jgi:hypothetical protein
MWLDKSKLSKANGYLEGTTDAITDERIAFVASEYKKNVSKNFISISPDQIEFRVSGEVYYITRKYDGEMDIIFFDGTNPFVVNTGGRVRLGIPCIEEAGKMLKKAGVKSAIIPAELYCNEKDGRKRVFDAISALSKESSITELCTAPFDIIEIDESLPRFKNYDEVYKKLEEIFSGSEVARPVLYTKASSKSEIKAVFKRWVEEEDSEGIVVRSDLPLIYKIKPKHTIDVAVVGYSEGTGESRNSIRTLLLAMMTSENRYQIVGKTGNGFSDDQKRELFDKFSKMVIDSRYIETDSNHVAFRMIRPETVIEISVNDVLFEASDRMITNPRLEIQGLCYQILPPCNGVSFIYPIFVRMRDDKQVNEVNVRLSQVKDFIYVPDLEVSQAAVDLPKSEILFREVYKKEAAGKLMVQKFVIWKTNKELLDNNYPAYVMHYTNFSSDRKEPLQRDVRTSNSEDQIREIAKALIGENVKKGWVKVDAQAQI